MPQVCQYEHRHCTCVAETGRHTGTDMGQVAHVYLARPEWHQLLAVLEKIDCLGSFCLKPLLCGFAFHENPLNIAHAKFHEPLTRFDGRLSVTSVLSVVASVGDVDLLNRFGIVAHSHFVNHTCGGDPRSYLCVSARYTFEA